MRIKGKVLDRPNQATVTIVRAGPGGEEAAVDRFDLLLTALPMGWDRLLRARGFADWPTPKIDYVKDASGEKVFDQDRKAQTRELTDDPKYVAGMAKMGRRYRAATLVELLRKDETVMWDAVPPSTEPSDPAEAKKAWAEWAEAIAHEIEQAGFTDEEVGQLLDVGRKLSCRIDVEDRLKDFLSM